MKGTMMDMSAMSDNSESSDDKTERSDDICRDFLRNVCKRGKRCKFRHPTADEVHVLGRSHEYTFCHDYQNSGCRRVNCKFIHCTREEEEYYKQTGQLPVRLQQAAALGIGVVPKELPLLKGEIPVCRDFLKGECKRGSRCKYRHVNNTPSPEYEYEKRPAPPVRTTVITNGTTYDADVYDYNHAPKRRKLDLTEAETIHLANHNVLANNHHNHTNQLYNHTLEGLSVEYRTLRTPGDYRLLEEENAMLRRRVEELKKQVSDLVATNEVLLEQNARYRVNKVSVVTTGPPVVTVSQMVTPTITPASAIARSSLPTQVTINPALNTSMAQIALTAATEMVVSQQVVSQQPLPPQHTQHTQHTQHPQRMPDLAQQASLAQAAINPPVSMAQNMVPVSLTQSLANPNQPPTVGSIAQPQATLQTAAVSLAQTSIQKMISVPSTAMVSYPIMSHTQIPTHTQIQNSNLV